MVQVVTNFEAEVLLQFEQTLLGLGGTLPITIQPGNFQERLLQLLRAIVVKLGGTVPLISLGNFQERFLQLVTAFALPLSGAALLYSPSNFELQALNRIEQTLLGLGGVIPTAAQPGNFEERFLQLLRAIALRSPSYSMAPPTKRSWIAQNDASYTYFDAAGSRMVALHDGVKATTALQTYGMMASPGDIFVHARLALPATLTSLSLWVGQFNGQFNLPTLMQLYLGFVVAPGTPLFSVTPATPAGEQVFTLPGNIVGQDFTVRLMAPGSSVSVFELEFYGT